MLALIAFRAYEVPTNVNGVSLAGDPFDVAAYTAPATAEEAATARLYERIPGVDVRNAPQETQSNVVGVLEVPALDDDLDSSAHEVLRARASEQKAADDDALHKQREAFLNDNREALDLLIQATSREACLLRNPLQADLLNPPQLSGSATAYYGLLSNAGRIAEADGKLDVALDYYLRGYRLARHFANRGTSLQCWDSVQAQQAVNGDIIRWAQHEKQTRLLLAQALGACHDERRRGGRDLFEDGPKTTYIVCRRMIDSGETVPALGNGYNGLRYTGSRFPWERTRQRKLLRLVTYWTATLHANDFAVYSPVTWLRAEPLSKSGAMAVKQLISTTPCPAIGAMQYEMAANPPVVPWTESPERALKKALDKLSNASAESASADLPGSHVSDEESIAAPELSPNQPQTPADLFQRR